MSDVQFGDSSIGNKLKASSHDHTIKVNVKFISMYSIFFVEKNTVVSDCIRL